VTITRFLLPRPSRRAITRDGPPDGCHLAASRRRAL